MKFREFDSRLSIILCSMTIVTGNIPSHSVMAKGENVKISAENEFSLCEIVSEKEKANDPDATRVNYTFDENSGCLYVSGNSVLKQSFWSELGMKDLKDSIRNVVINDGISEICDWCFEGCSSLQNISIPNSVKIVGECAFFGCKSLTNVNVPDSVTEIYKGAFAYCTSLKSFKVPKSVKIINEGTFEGCNALESVIIPDSVEHIGSWAFAACKNLKEIDVPNSVKKVDECAFKGCGLSESKRSEFLRKFGLSIF